MKYALHVQLIIAALSTPTASIAQPPTAPPPAMQLAHLRAMQAALPTTWCGLSYPGDFMAELIAAAIHSDQSASHTAELVEKFSAAANTAEGYRGEVCSLTSTYNAGLRAASELAADFADRLERGLLEIRGDKPTGAYDDFMAFLEDAASSDIFGDLLDDDVPNPDELQLLLLLFDPEPYLIMAHGLDRRRTARFLDRAYQAYRERECQAILTDSASISNILHHHAPPPSQTNTEMFWSAADGLGRLIMASSHSRGDTFCERENPGALTSLIAPAIERSILWGNVHDAESELEDATYEYLGIVSQVAYALITELLQVPSVVVARDSIREGRLPFPAADLRQLLDAHGWYHYGMQFGAGDGKSVAGTGTPVPLLHDWTPVTVYVQPRVDCDDYDAARTKLLQAADSGSYIRDALLANHGHCDPPSPLSSPLLARFGGVFTGTVLIPTSGA